MERERRMEREGERRDRVREEDGESERGGGIERERRMERVREEEG